MLKLRCHTSIDICEICVSALLFYLPDQQNEA